MEGYDEPFPSVTTVLNVIAKPALVPWARNVALEKVRETLYEHLASGNQVIDPLWVDAIIEQATPPARPSAGPGGGLRNPSSRSDRGRLSWAWSRRSHPISPR